MTSRIGRLGLALLFNLLIVGALSVALASTNNHTREEAVTWAGNMKGTKVDYYQDGSIECMDLVAGCYYNYLGHPWSGIIFVQSRKSPRSDRIRITGR